MPTSRWKTQSVVERGETDILLSDLLIDGRLDFYPDVISSNFFNFSLKGDKLVLLAGNHIGIIPLNDRVALLVEPKIGRENWIHIIGKARGNLRALEFLVRYSRLDTTSQSLLEFLGKAFLLQIRSVEREGLYRQYTSRDEIIDSPRGRILFENSIRIVWPRGNFKSGAFRNYLFGADTPHNRLLKYALHLTINLLILFPRTSSELRRQMVDYENMFSLVPLDSTLGYLHYVLESLKEHSIPEIRSYYYEICQTAILVIEQAGLRPKEHAPEETLLFVVNMENVFQDYCYNIMRDLGSLFEEKTIIYHEPEGRIPLFSGLGSDTKSTAEPDILVIRPREVCLPIEVKYKDNPSRVDINQAITYAIAYGSNKVILLCFASENYQPGWQYFGRVGTQIDVWVYRINLDDEEIESEERKLAEEIKKKLQE